jgi:hypothetical protein
VCLIVASVLLLSAGRAFADGWPQWRGPNWDCTSKEAGLLKEWPKDGPRLLWQVKGDIANAGGEATGQR